MRIRDSGMPEEEYWESLFDIPLILDRLGINHLGTGRFHDVAELGCGYGTFTVPIAQAISGTLYAFDIDPAMLARTRERGEGLSIQCQERDVVQHGFGVEVDAVLLFNILHCESPTDLLCHAASALRPGGEVLIVHWQHRETPRGPSLDIRPRPEQNAEWATAAGLAVVGDPIDLPPWHYGLVCRREV